MEKTKIIVELGDILNKDKINKILSLQHHEALAVKIFLDLTFHKNGKVAFRSAWILENIYITSTDSFFPEVKKFLELFCNQNNFSCRRHYAKILALMTSKKAPLAIKEIINNYDTAQLVETVFGWLIDDKVPVAVKSHCLNILANLYQKHSWIKEELIETMDYLVDKESIAFYAKAKQIRKQLKSI